MDIHAMLESVLTLSLKLSHWHQLGLAFLLGSFAVATLSDLRRQSAQREFVEIWVIFLVAVLVFDILDVRRHRIEWYVPTLKWALLVLFSALSSRRVGVLFRLAPGDVAALAAAASLLSPVLLVLYYVIAKGLAMLLGPVLARGRSTWPFMPVVSLATLAVLGLGLMA
jgi:hypothetical protein